MRAFPHLPPATRPSSSDRMHRWNRTTRNPCSTQPYRKGAHYDHPDHSAYTTAEGAGRVESGAKGTTPAMRATARCPLPAA